MRLVRFSTRTLALATSRAEALRRGCGRDSLDVTRYWHADLAEALYLDDAESIPTGATELLGQARVAYEATHRPRL